MACPMASTADSQAGKLMKKRRKNLEFTSMEDLFRHMPDILTVRNDHQLGDMCTVLPASANVYADPSSPLDEAFGSNNMTVSSNNMTVARKPWWTTFHQDEYNMFRDFVQRAIEDWPDGVPFIRFCASVKEKAGTTKQMKTRRKELGFDSFDEMIKTMPDLVYLQDDPYVPGGMLVFRAEQAPDDPDKKIARQEWLLFKDVVSQTMQMFPKGVGIKQFAQVSGLNTRPARKRRRALGYQTLPLLLRSMSDVVTVNLPECEHPEDFLAWLTPPGYAGPLPEFTLAPKPEKEDPGKTFAGPYDLPGYLRPGFDMLRKLVHKYITYFPKGITLQEFSKESGLSQPKWKLRRRLFGYYKLVDLLQDMPDIITLVESDEDPQLFYKVYPASTNMSADIAPTKHQLPLEALVVKEKQDVRVTLPDVPRDPLLPLATPPPDRTLTAAQQDSGATADSTTAAAGDGSEPAAAGVGAAAAMGTGAQAHSEAQIVADAEAEAEGEHAADVGATTEPPSDPDRIPVSPLNILPDGGPRALAKFPPSLQTAIANLPTVSSERRQGPGEYNLLRELTESGIRQYNIATLLCASPSGLRTEEAKKARRPSGRLHSAVINRKTGAPLAFTRYVSPKRKNTAATISPAAAAARAAAGKMPANLGEPIDKYPYTEQGRHHPDAERKKRDKYLPVWDTEPKRGASSLQCQCSCHGRGAATGGWHRAPNAGPLAVGPAAAGLRAQAAATAGCVIS